MAAENVKRIEVELDQCVQQLQQIDSTSSEAVARHPAFRRVRGSVQNKIETLHATLNQARDAYDQERRLAQEAVLEYRQAKAQEEEQQVAAEPQPESTVVVQESR